MKSLNRVLIIDDQPDFLNYYKENLEDNGVSVLLLSGLPEAHKEICTNGQTYDVFVVDLMMQHAGSRSESEEAFSGGPPDLRYVEGGLAMGRWILDCLPGSASVVVLTNRDLGKLTWLNPYEKKFARFAKTSKSDCPGPDFFDYLSEFMGIDDGKFGGRNGRR